jgi:hypothetical protein
MVNRVQTLRSSVPGARPNARAIGELYVNFPELQFGVVNAGNLAQDLLAIRFFSTLSPYAVGDYVIEAGRLYRAIVAVAPGAFNPAQWEVNLMIDDAGGLLAGYLPLSGGTLTGALTLAANAAQALQPVTLQQLNAALGAYLPLTGGALAGPGNLDIAGVLTVTGPNSLLLNGAAGQPRGIIGGTSLTARWQMLLADTTAETGANAGSNFQLNAFADNGGPLSTPLAVERATGRVTLINDLSINRPSGSTRSLLGRAGGNARWELQLGGPTAETGANAGSNFNLLRYDDGGVLIPGPSPLSINRATGVATFANVSAPQALGDNLVINGDVRIDQRNAAINVSGYGPDRWRYASTPAAGARGNFVRGGGPNSQTTALGFPYFLNWSSLGAYTALAGEVFTFYQILEADVVGALAWGTTGAQPATLSFYASSSQTGTFSGSVRDFAGTRTFVFTFNIPTANVVTRYVIPIPPELTGAWVNAGNAASLIVGFDLGSGATFRAPATGAWQNGNFIGANGAVSLLTATGGFSVTGVKLEVGSVATPFNRQSLAKTFLDCQRYHQNVACNSRFAATAANQFMTTNINFTLMRVNPTAAIFTVGSRVNMAATYPQFASLLGNAAGFTIASAAAGDCYAVSDIWAFDAELN